MKKSLLLLALLPALSAPAMAALFVADYAAVPKSASVPPAPSAPGAAPVAGPRTAGLYVQVLDGTILMANPGGSQTMSTGQFGYVGAAATPPVMLPQNPGLMYTPPPTFQPPGAGSRPPVASNVGAVFCEVR